MQDDKILSRLTLIFIAKFKPLEILINVYLKVPCLYPLLVSRQVVSHNSYEIRSSFLGYWTPNNRKPRYSLYHIDSQTKQLLPGEVFPRYDLGLRNSTYPCFIGHGGTLLCLFTSKEPTVIQSKSKQKPTPWIHASGHRSNPFDQCHQSLDFIQWPDDQWPRVRN